MRRLTEALLLALLLIAVQTAILTHDHREDQSPASAVVQGCEFCTGNHAAAPAPDPADATRHAAAPLVLAGLQPGSPRPTRFSSAHRSRAPPAFRSV